MTASVLVSLFEDIGLLDLTTTFTALGISLGLGLLVGLQREWVGSRVAGFRTFPLITLLGSLSAILAGPFGGWIVGAAFVGVVAAVVLGNLLTETGDGRGAGMTTEVAMLVMFLVGVLVVAGPWEVAVAVGGCVVVLLHAKVRLHNLAERLSDRDVQAIVQFALITLVVLPVLPNRTFGPYDVLNPRHIWLMVVLVVGISLGAYVAFKLFGQRAGLSVSGFLGGLISSTATTAGLTRRAADGAPVKAAALGVLIASAVVYVRVIGEIGVVAPRVFTSLVHPLLVMLVLFSLVLVPAWFGARQKAEIEIAEPDNPTQLKSALLFGFLFGAVLFAVAVARENFGDKGIYFVAAVSGLTDMDAITISTARMVSESRIDASTGWRAILLASVSNLLFKLGIVGVLGGRTMLLHVAVLFLPGLIGSGFLLAFW